MMLSLAVIGRNLIFLYEIQNENLVYLDPPDWELLLEVDGNKLLLNKKFLKLRKLTIVKYSGKKMRRKLKKSIFQARGRDREAGARDRRVEETQA